MLTLLTSKQARIADQYTIEHEPIASFELMERASLAFVEAFIRHYPDKELVISIYCGTGNNGGDGLAIGRLLLANGYKRLNLKIIRFSENSTPDFDINFNRLKSVKLQYLEIKEFEELPDENAELIIDAILGTGLNKPLEGAWKDTVIWLQRLNKKIVSVDIPTGFVADGLVSEKTVAVKSVLTLTFQRPKINFLLPESAAYIDRFEVLEIGLDEDYIQSMDSMYFLLTAGDITARIKLRQDFSHKGTYGHALIIAGSPETMGAALLCSEASLYTGSGLTTACIPIDGLTALNTRVPEVMAVLRTSAGLQANFSWNKYNSIAIGPGLGTSSACKSLLQDVIRNFQKPIVFDADALNVLSGSPDLLIRIPKFSVLTPHLKEFDRLFGEHNTWWARIETAKHQSKALSCYIVLKNRYSILITPDGRCLFNPTGSPAMASGGMGDVLTGMIASFLAQGYHPEDACILGMFLHGKAGDEVPGYVVPASELVQKIPAVAQYYLSESAGK